jgi:hypothetical protein
VLAEELVLYFVGVLTGVLLAFIVERWIRLRRELGVASEKLEEVRERLET